MPPAVISELQHGTSRVDRGAKYTHWRSVMRCYGAVSGAALVAAGIISLWLMTSKPSQTGCEEENTLHDIISFWITILGAFLAMAEMKIKIVLKLSKLLEMRSGRAFMYIFLGTLALGARWVGIIVGPICVLCGVANGIFSCWTRCVYHHDPDPDPDPDLDRDCVPDPGPNPDFEPNPDPDSEPDPDPDPNHHPDFDLEPGPDPNLDFDPDPDPDPDPNPSPDLDPDPNPDPDPDLDSDHEPDPNPRPNHDRDFDLDSDRDPNIDLDTDLYRDRDPNPLP
eukprot:NODE_1318_length_1008_cov_7.556830_g1016_i0.p1 GENE.NODE_1318_length_1008_cov_7.556830_g1016_i0~~NODE_1318_length_1008_cov_7.556830_g1016_i0.p1  ORF type:complete len:306 (+),score=69.31 NODE_1318_length_1008_cov_7.556830_g1016_i0:81-920(+)